MKHPDYCYSHDSNNNCTIIKWGEGGYYQTDYPGEYTDEVIDSLNAERDITQIERDAMEICSIVAQDNPDLNWDEHYEMCIKMIKNKRIELKGGLNDVYE